MGECQAEEEAVLARLRSSSDFPWVRSPPTTPWQPPTDHDARHAGHGVGDMREISLILMSVEGKPVIVATGATGPGDGAPGARVAQLGWRAGRWRCDWAETRRSRWELATMRD
jgi:hypothetical protein